MKKINIAILGVITMISLGLILNYLFSSDESEVQEVTQNTNIETASEVDEAGLVDEVEQTEDQTEDQADDVSVDEYSDEYSEEEDSEQAQNQEPADTDSQTSEGHSVEESSETSQQDQPSDNQVSTPSDTPGGQTQTSDNQDEQSSEDFPEGADESQEATDQSQPDSSEAQDPVDSVVIIVDARQDSGNIYFGEILYQTGDTALSILERFAQERGLPIQLSQDQSKEGTFVVGIGDHLNTDNSNWELYINGNLTIYSPSSNKVAPGSRIRYHYNEINM